MRFVEQQRCAGNSGCTSVLSQRREPWGLWWLWWHWFVIRGGGRGSGWGASCEEKVQQASTSSTSTTASAARCTWPIRASDAWPTRAQYNSWGHTHFFHHCCECAKNSTTRGACSVGQAFRWICTISTRCAHWWTSPCPCYSRQSLQCHQG